MKNTEIIQAEQITEMPLALEVRKPVTGDFDLDIALETVLSGGIYIHQFSGKEINHIAKLFADEIEGSFNREGGFDIFQLTKIDRRKLEEMWSTLAPKSSEKRVVHILLNDYRPFSYIPKHTDLSNHPTLVEEDEPLESMLTFLYVIEGKKDILFYTNGLDEEPITVKQEPGMLFIFAMGDMVSREGEYIAHAPYHEVPRQNSYCKTISWEVGKVLHSA